MELGDFKGAYSAAREALALAPNSSYIHYVLAFIYSRDGKPDLSEAALALAIAIDPERVYYYELLASVRLQQQKWDDALLAAEHGLQLMPGHIFCASHRSIALMRLGRKNEALSSAQRTLSQQPDAAISHSTLGFTLMSKGEYFAAEQRFREALRLEPRQTFARLGMMQAVKAHHMPPFFNWVGKRTGNQRFLLTILLVIAANILNCVSDMSPAAVLVWHIALSICFIFCCSTWLAVPLGNLVLRRDTVARYLLSRRQIHVAHCYGGLILLVVGSMAAWLFRHQPGWLTLVSGFLIVLCLAELGFREVSKFCLPTFAAIATLVALYTVNTAITSGL